MARDWWEEEEPVYEEPYEDVYVDPEPRGDRAEEVRVDPEPADDISVAYSRAPDDAFDPPMGGYDPNLDPSAPAPTPPEAQAPTRRQPVSGTDWDQFDDEATAQAWLDMIGQKYGTSVGETDRAQLMGKESQGFEDFQRALEQQYARRGRSGTNMGGGSGAGASGGTGGGGGASTRESNRASLQSQGSYYGGPGTQGVMQGPVQQVGQDPFSKAITGGYGELLEGRGGLQDWQWLNDYFKSMAEGKGAREEAPYQPADPYTSTPYQPEDPSIRAQRMEAKRQPIEAFRRMQTNQARGALANRGLLSEPGMAQGSEIGALGRIEDRLAPFYATAGQELAGDESDREREWMESEAQRMFAHGEVEAQRRFAHGESEAQRMFAQGESEAQRRFAHGEAQAGRQDDRLSQALTLATGMEAAQAQNFLRTLEGSTDRQRVLSEIALGTLDRNMVWNQFLAEFGLKRDMALEAVTSGRIEDLNTILALFQQYVNTSAGGYV